mmetsp:Transcript_50540/g.123255  ORF Transcript_50540/g.123255 Transcript_50540/m.123255 type:complete len:258 (+) Transcript_50540:363-1136(+)
MLSTPRGRRLAAGAAAASLLGLFLMLPPSERESRAPPHTHTEKVSGGAEPLEVYAFPRGLRPQHLDIVDEGSFEKNGTLPLHEAHLRGYLHRGAWVFVADSAGLLLFVRRAETMRTCPGKWGPVGEHHKPGEDAEQNAIRCIREELGPRIVGHLRVSQNLTEHALYYYRRYDDGREDKQATNIWLFILDSQHTILPFEFDDEVSGTKWISVEEVITWAQERPADFCHESITKLLAFCLVPLQQQMRQHLPGSLSGRP